VNGFDTGIIDFLNQFSHDWRRFDEGVSMLTDLDLLKGGVFMAALWWAWFRSDKLGPQTRSMVIMAIVTAVLAVGLGRGLAHVLPFRERPLHTPGFDFTQPYGADDELFSGWSSFPSDHGALFGALITSLFFIWRPLGIASAVYAFVFIFVPRLYLGLHWPTDIIAGVALGVAVAWVGMQPRVRDPVSKPVFRLQESYPALFYAGAFLLMYQIAVLFLDARRMGSYAAHTVKLILT
jgi:undecaprenyl-diphosphatase